MQFPHMLAADFGIESYFFFIILAIIVVVLLSILGKFISLWFQAFVSGTPIPLQYHWDEYAQNSAQDHCQRPD